MLTSNFWRRCLERVEDSMNAASIPLAPRVDMIFPPIELVCAHDEAGSFKSKSICAKPDIWLKLSTGSELGVTSR